MMGKVSLDSPGTGSGAEGCFRLGEGLYRIGRWMGPSVGKCTRSFGKRDGTRVRPPAF